MKPNSVVHAAAIDLDHERVPTDQALSGQPRTGVHTLTEFGGLEVGVWEMTPGVMSDVESDEVFVVLSGSATVEFADEGETLHIGAGDVVRRPQAPGRSGRSPRHCARSTSPDPGGPRRTSR